MSIVDNLDLDLTDKRAYSDIHKFDLIKFIEYTGRHANNETNGDKFSFSNNVLRPKHIILLYQFFSMLNVENVFTIDAPVVVIDGDINQVTTTAFVDFRSLLMFIEDQQKINDLYLLSISRQLKNLDDWNPTQDEVFVLRFISKLRTIY